MPGDLFSPAAADPSSPRDRAPVLRGATLSVAAHALALVVVLIAVSRAPASFAPEVRPPSQRLIYTISGDGGGGMEGGGNDSPVPTRSASSAGADAAIVPVAPAAPTTVTPSPDPVAPAERLPVAPPEVSAGLSDAIGSTTAVKVGTDSRGLGTGPGADGRAGDGIGDGLGGGPGNRRGPGSDGVDGERPGNGVSWPRLIQEVKPNYSPDAMRAHIEGVVHLEIVVLADGSVGRITLTRSLDSRFGLDREAIDAVRRWRFDPARRLGAPVAARVPVEVAFSLR